MSVGLEHLPVEILEQIVKKINNGESLKNIRRVSDKFAHIVQSAEKDGALWQRICKNEIPNDFLVDLVFRIYPHMGNVETQVERPCERQHGSDYVDWHLVYTTWGMHDKILTQPVSELTYSLGPDIFTKISEILTHGDLIIVLYLTSTAFRFTDTMAFIGRDFIQVVTDGIDDKKFYVVPTKSRSTDRTTENEIKFPCPDCECIAIPINQPDDENIGFYTNHYTCEVRNSNSRIYDNSQVALLHKALPLEPCNWVSSMGWKRLMVNTKEKSKIDLDYRKLKVEVLAVKRYGRLIFLGTVTGTLYAYNLNNLTPTEEEIEDGKVVFAEYEVTRSNCTWKKDVGCSAIISIDVAELPASFLVACASKTSIYRYYFSRKKLQDNKTKTQ